MTLKIGHFLNYLDEGGTPNMVLSLVSKSRHDHTYITFKSNDRRKQEFADRGVKLIEIGSDDLGKAVELAKQYDVWHCQNSGGPEPGVSIGIKAQKPTIETCQSPSLPTGSMYKDLVTVVPVSNGILEYWDEGLHDRVIYSCAERVTYLSRSKAKEHFGLDFNRMTVGRVGRFEGIKRPTDFIQAACIIGKLRPDTEFLLVGDGSDMKGIKYEVKRIRDEDGIDIKLPGFLSGVDKVLAYNAMDIFLYPTSMEGFGIVFAEAMSIGLPIVTYSDPVNLDVVGSAGVFAVDNVYTSTPRPFHSLAHLTLDLLENDRNRKLLVERAVDRYEKRYTPERMAAEYDDLYEELVS